MTAALLSTGGTPTGGRVAFLPRASFKLPNYANVDLRLAKAFSLRERFNFEFRAEVFNLFNSTLQLDVNKSAYTFAQPGGTGCPSAQHTNTCVVRQSTFQQVTTTTANLLGARQMQLGFRFAF